LQADGPEVGLTKNSWPNEEDPFRQNIRMNYELSMQKMSDSWTGRQVSLGRRGWG